ncbi:MAG: plasmid pRiA4b ORF-3 family protein [Bacteroidaceae bacterium]|nr:plasmid pRiA4b ORF-3 family protein [Bacteroidaceae bacterium]
MANIVKMNPVVRKEDMIEQQERKSVDDIVAKMSRTDRDLLESLGITSMDELSAVMKLMGDGSNEEEIHSLPRNFFLKTDDVKEYHIRIKLNNSPVKVWRELKVPSNISMELFAKFLMHAMGWEDCHLYQFRKRGNRHERDILYKGQSACDTAEEMYGKSPWYQRSEDANEHTLAEVLPEKGDRIIFEYDFGDKWNHDVWVKGIRDYKLDEEHGILLVRGQGACPPEDCGGVWGYEDLLAIREKKRKSKEEKERLEWYGMDTPDFDTNYYDLEDEQDFIEDYWDFIKGLLDEDE